MRKSHKYRYAKYVRMVAMEVTVLAQPIFGRIDNGLNEDS